VKDGEDLLLKVGLEFERASEKMGGDLAHFYQEVGWVIKIVSFAAFNFSFSGFILHEIRLSRGLWIATNCKSAFALDIKSFWLLMVQFMAVKSYQ
jgi:hypothetical protein